MVHSRKNGPELPSRYLEGMIEVIDEFYSTNLAQDTIRGMRENAARGFYNGGIPPIGYKTRKVADGNAKRNVLEPNERFAPVVRRIFQMYADGMGAKEIVKTLNNEGLRTNRGKPWSKNVVYYILNNEAYVGILIWGGSNPKEPSEAVRVEDNHPPLVHRETFDKVQLMIEQRSVRTTHPRTVNSDYLLSGLLYCGKCGATMLGNAAKSSRFFYYACHNYAKRGKSVCDAKLVNKDQLEAFVIDRLTARILTEENLRELVRLTNEKIRQTKDTFQEHLAVIEDQLADVQGRLQKLYEALETGKLALEDLAPRIKDLKGRVDELEERRRQTRERLHEGTIEIVGKAKVKAYHDVVCT